MALIKCDECGKEYSSNADKCPECGNPTNGPVSRNNNQNPILTGIGSLVLIGFMVFGGIKAYNYFNKKEEKADKSQYVELDYKQLHKDYESNEISAKDKYEGNYYYLTAKIDDVNSYLGDYYLDFHFAYKKDNSEQVEISAYFKNENDLKNVNKGDTVTVYCKFKGRTIHKYMGVTTGYSMKQCHFESDF